MKRSLFAAFALSALAAGAADTLAPGKYAGTYDLQTRTGPVQVSIQLDITEVKKDHVAGTVAMMGSGGCDGDYKMAGKYAKGSLSLKSTEKSGRAHDCNFNFKVKPEGDKLVGKTGGGRDLTLTKK